MTFYLSVCVIVFMFCYLPPYLKQLQCHITVTIVPRTRQLTGEITSSSDTDTLSSVQRFQLVTSVSVSVQKDEDCVSSLLSLFTLLAAHISLNAPLSTK